MFGRENVLQIFRKLSWSVHGSIRLVTTILTHSLDHLDHAPTKIGCMTYKLKYYKLGDAYFLMGWLRSWTIKMRWPWTFALLFSLLAAFLMLWLSLVIKMIVSFIVCILLNFINHWLSFSSPLSPLSISTPKGWFHFWVKYEFRLWALTHKLFTHFSSKCTMHRKVHFLQKTSKIESPFNSFIANSSTTPKIELLNNDSKNWTQHIEMH